jgi:hypothetical protein
MGSPSLGKTCTFFLIKWGGLGVAEKKNNLMAINIGKVMITHQFWNILEPSFQTNIPPSTVQPLFHMIFGG